LSDRYSINIIATTRNEASLCHPIIAKIVESFWRNVREAVNAQLSIVASLDLTMDVSASSNNYIDYSCSTSIERLARDIETILHSWHVDGGNDRHFSSTHSNQNANVTGSTTHDANAMPEAATANALSTLLLRSERIVWNISLYYNASTISNASSKFHASDGMQKERVQCDVELQLSLWDAPVSTSSTTTLEGSDVDTIDLPYSLQRSLHDNDAGCNSTGWFNNFSLLYGIGQHITLTPVYPYCLQSDHRQPPLSMSHQQLLDYISYVVLSLEEGRSATMERSAPSTHSVAKGRSPQRSPSRPKTHDPSITGNTNLSQRTMTTVPMILSQWLQTALNIAVSNCDCYIPVFGLWGEYNPSSSTSRMWNAVTSSNAMDRSVWVHHPLPQWLRASFQIDLSKDVEHRYQNKLRRRDLNAAKRLLQHGTILHEPIVCGHLWSPSMASVSFWCGQIIQPAEQPHWKWNVWGDILQGQTESSSLIHLCRAQHTYIWKKQRPAKGSLLWQALGGALARTQRNEMIRDWRSSSPAICTRDQQDFDLLASLHEYRKQCQQYALKLLEQAAGASNDDDHDPLWGPIDDPLESAVLHLIWSAQDSTQPLLTLPLHSRHALSESDWKEMVDATEYAILDPYRSHHAALYAQFDPNVCHATLATTQRCVLAALIRCATLPKETLLASLIDVHTIHRWDTEAGNRSATALCKKANVDTSTKSLVAAMDWKHASTEMIDRLEAESIVRSVLNDSIAFGFPQPPDEIVALLVGDDGTMLDDAESHEKPSIFWKPLLKSAPPGRLLSLLCFHMARVRSPSSMAIVWSVFVEELRRRWDARESLPNMNYVPGLDLTMDSVAQDQSNPGLASRQYFESIGTKAKLSALVHSLEPDPDDFHCLIGQKLQVFNLGVEMISSEVSKAEQSEKRQRLRLDEIDADEFERPHLKSPPSSTKTLLNGSIVDGIPFVDDVATTRMETNGDDWSKSTTTQEEYFDAMDCVFTDSPKKIVRVGARCPIQGLYLSQTGDQIYAPYLQRAMPITDDILAERRLVLSKHNRGPVSETVQQRIEIAQRFQKPKLLSDMRSFKAANPSSTFEDFICWYGNPVDTDPSIGIEFTAISDSFTPVVQKLSQANKAIQALELIRNFWIETWAEAEPMPAIEQDPLFDAESTVEVALDFLENIHPATLICQVAAVNLAMSYFSLSACAGESMALHSVRVALSEVRAVVDDALQHLASDATLMIDAAASTNNVSTESFNTSNPHLVASVASIASCTRACEAISKAEVVISRATSFLRKLPKRYQLVESMLTIPDGVAVPYCDDSDRDEMLNTIGLQQELFLTSEAEVKVKPAVREYVLRNVDDLSPCQLSVQTSDEGMNVVDSDHKPFSILALTRSIRQF
jgi:Rab3 GTPase-activating protein catalytic subunit